MRSMGIENFKNRLLGYYEEWPFEHHPLWRSILSHELDLVQVLKAETQHYLRTKSGQTLRKAALMESRSKDAGVFAALLKIYLEECTHDASGPSHLDLIKRLLIDGGVQEAELETALPTPGNSAAIALYKDISTRGAGCHLIGAGAVEYYYCMLSPRIFEAYVGHYRMSQVQAETYRLHGPMDREHADGAFSVLMSAVEMHGEKVVEMSVRDAFVATSLHYDGMLQAATGVNSYWSGKL